MARNALSDLPVRLVQRHLDQILQSPVTESQKKKKLIKGNWSTCRPLGISLHYLTPPFKHLRQLTSTVIILSSHSSPTSKHLFSSSKTPCSSPEYSKSRLTLKSLIFYFWFRNTSVGGMGVVMLEGEGKDTKERRTNVKTFPSCFWVLTNTASSFPLTYLQVFCWGWRRR